MFREADYERVWGVLEVCHGGSVIVVTAEGDRRRNQFWMGTVIAVVILGGPTMVGLSGWSHG